MKNLKKTVVKFYLTFLIGITILYSCGPRGGNVPPSKYKLIDLIKGKTFIVNQWNGKPYDGTGPNVLPIGEVNYINDTTYTSSVSFWGTRDNYLVTYTGTNYTDSTKGIYFNMITPNGTYRYQTYDDAAFSQNGVWYLNGFKLRNVVQASDTLILGKKSQ